MPLFQSEEGKFLSTKKINPNKLTKSNHGKIESLLTLSGTEEGTFTLMFLFDQILSADFFFKDFQTLLEVKIEINQVILTPCLAH